MESASSEELRRYLRELFALATLPAVWARCERPQMAADVADCVQRTVDADLVYVSLRDRASAHHVVRAANGPALEPEPIAAALASVIERGVGSARVEILGRPMNLVVRPLTVAGRADLGVVVAAAERAGFPRELDGALLRVVANHATVALQNATYLTELREAAETREALVAELAATSLRKDEFLAVLGHELRNPLAAIQAAHAHSLGVGGDQRANEIISHQLPTLIRLVDDLLEISRVNTGKLELQTAIVDLRAIVDHALTGCRAAATRKQHEVVANLGTEGLWVEGDAVRLEQAVVNVISNAVRYTPPGGHLTVTASRVADGDALLRVTDDGCGVAPEVLGRIFEPFVQADSSLHRAESGLGLGLALVKGIVDLHGGSVALSSAGPGTGCTVTVRLPLVPAPPEVAAPTPSARARKALRVLFVDDNEEMTEMLSILIEGIGHETKTAADGHAALDVAMQFCPHVAFIDIGLPGLDGFEVASRLRSALPRELVLVAMSGYGQDADRRRSSAAGFDHHFLKPVKLETIQTILTSVAAQ